MQNVRCSPAIAQYETMPREGGMKKMTPFCFFAHGGITIEKNCRTIFVWEHAEPWNWSNSRAFYHFWVGFHGVPIMHIFVTTYIFCIGSNLVNQNINPGGFHPFTLAKPYQILWNASSSAPSLPPNAGRKQSWTVPLDQGGRKQLLDLSHFNRGSGWTVWYRYIYPKKAPWRLEYILTFG